MGKIEIKETTDLKWHTEKRKVKDLKLFEGNPRKMTKEQAEQLLISLKKFNLVEIPAIDQNNRVIAGNMRIQALRTLGRDEEEIEVRVPNRPLTEEEAREYLIRSNKNVGEWDFDLLVNFDEDLLKNIGFENKELDKIFDLDLGEKEKEDEVPEPRKKTDIKYGNIFQLEKHRLMCGDATKKEDVEKLLDGKKADMVFTDPPYAIFGSSTGVNKSIADYKMVIPFFREWIKNILISVKINFDFYICCDWRSYPFIFTILNENGFEVKNLIVWDKIVTGLGYFYRQRHEFVIVAGFSKINALRKGKISQGSITDENLWQIQRDKEKKHNASKPIELVERAIKNSSKKENDIVLD